MTGRWDGLRSYQVRLTRVVSAVVTGESDPDRPPLRRGFAALLGGLMVAVLLGAGYAGYGVLSSTGGDGWRTEGAVVIERETGARYVHLGGVLHPVLNYTSAVLAAGRPDPEVVRVAASVLDGVPRGTPVGIPGAPDSLPAPGRRAGLPWTVCATPALDATGREPAPVGLAVAVQPVGGRPLDDRGVLVRDAQLGMSYLVWHGHRHLVQESRVLLPALFGAATPVRVGTAWLNTLPAGTDIAPVPVPGRGEESTAVPRRRVGDLLAVDSPERGVYLVLDDGVAPLTPLQLAVLTAQSAARPAPVPAGEVSAAPRSGQLRPAAGDAPAPDAPPELLRPGDGEQLCAVTGEPRSAPTVLLGASVPGLDAAPVSPATPANGVPLADRVLVPPGRVATVWVMTSPTADSGPFYLIGDLGVRYAVPDPATLRLLGYPPEEAVGVPASLVARIPSGPNLDPSAALRPVPVTTVPGG
jgi:type VII secretion protein EccB